MNGEKPKEEASVYKVLSNPHRRRIIEMIGLEGKTGFTELRKDLGMSVGALYHHIDSLGGLVMQDGQHKYVLTRQGKMAYKLMNEATDQFSSESSFDRKRSGSSSKSFTGIAEIFFPRRLLLSVSDKPILYVPMAAIIVALGAWAAIQANLRFLLVFPDNQTTLSPILGAGFFVVSWLVLFGLCDLLSTFVFGRKGGDLALLVGSSLAFLPLILFSGLWYLFRTNRFDTTGTVVPVLLILFQLWTIVVLSCAISLSKGLRIERSALISFIVTYIGIVFFLFGQIYK
jgi:DNA-binding transcriptional ArsR family regulator